GGLAEPARAGCGISQLADRQGRTCAARRARAGGTGGLIHAGVSTSRFADKTSETDGSDFRLPNEARTIHQLPNTCWQPRKDVVGAAQVDAVLQYARGPFAIVA